MITNRFVKYLSNVLGGAIICIALSGCENFLGDVNLKQQLAEDIAYAKAKSIAILIQADEGTGTVVPAGNYTAKQGYPFEISFTEAAGYSFNGWKAVPADDAESLPENAVVFDDPNSIKTNVTVNADISNIKIVPGCDDRIAVKEKSPLLGNTVSRNSSIVVVFSKEPDKQSFIFSEDEIPEGAETVKNDDEEIYAYVHEGETKFKNIQITINDISIAQHYMQPQVEGKTLVINANPARLIEFDQAGSSKIVSVTLSDTIFDKDNVSMNKTENWKFTINEETNEKARIELTSNTEEGAVYLAGTRDYSMGQKITLSFTENADYQFLNWQYDNNIVTVDDPYSSDTFAFVKAESNATQIKAVCAPRLRVTEVSPLSTESVSKNTPIEITFNKDLPVDDKGLLQLENISITIGGSPVRTSFKTPEVSNNKITFTADMQNMLDVPAGQTKTVTVTVPSDFYYQLEDENKTKVYYGGNGKTFSYRINETTSQKAFITFSASEGSGTIVKNADSSQGYSIGQEVDISFEPADGWKFTGWKITSGGEAVDESKIKIEDITALSTKLVVYDYIEVVTVTAQAYLEPVIQSVKLNGKVDFFSVNSCNCDASVHISFNKEIAQSSVDFSDTGSLTLTKSGNPALHYENYFTDSWKSATELVLTPKDSVKELLPQSSDTLYLIITLNANKKNITDIDSHSLCPSDAVYNSLLLNYTIAGTTETTPPVITDIHLYSTNDTSDYYYRELSPKAFSKWTNTQFTGVEGLNYGDGIYNQNHVSSVGIEISGYDSDSGIKEIQVTETYLRNSKNQAVVPLDVTHKYEVSPSSSTPDSAGNIIKKYSILYNFDSANTIEDGLFSIDVSLLDNAGNTSEKKTYYVIKDTTNSSNPKVITPGDIDHLIPIYNAENNCYEMDYMFKEFKPGTDYFFEKNNENYQFVTQRYITVILKSGNIEYEIYKEDIEDTYDIADVINSAFSGRKRNVDIDEELIIKIKEESGVVGEFSIPLLKRSYIAGKAEHSIYLYDQVLPTDKTDKDEVIVYFSYTPTPTKDELTEYWFSSQEVIEPEAGRISYLFCCLITKTGSSEIYRPLYLNKPYIFYNGVDKPESDPTVRFPTITLPNASLESGEIQYEPNTGRATFSINLDYPNDYDYSQYTYILYIGDGTLVDYGNGREEGDQCYSDTSKITTWTGRIHNVYLIAYNSDCEEVARSEPQQLNLQVVDNHSPVMYMYGNNHESYNSINNYHYMFNIFRAFRPYDYNEKRDKVYNLTSVDCYFVPTSYGKALSKDYVTSGLFKKAALTLSENYRSDGYLSIPYDGIDFGRYYVYFYLEDNSPLHNWSITPGSYPLVYYVADYAPDFAVDTENDQITISAPTYTKELKRTNNFPAEGTNRYADSNIHSNYVIIQTLENNKWTGDVVCTERNGPGVMKNKDNTDYYYGYGYDNDIWIYSADCAPYSEKFLRVNVNFTSNTKDWGYQRGGNEFDIVQSQPIYVYPDYLRYKGTPDEIVCNNKNWIEGANGYQIFTDNPMFVHTMYCSRNLSEVLKVEKTNPTTEQFIREWESRAQEGGMVTYNDTKLTSFTYGMDNIRDIPSGYYYTTIVHFADGTTLMSDVKQK